MEKGRKIYAVKQGRNVGLFYSWAECEQQIKGYSGAQYKGFTDLNSAQEYLGKGEESTLISTPPKDEMVAYVDGSFNVVSGQYSAGVVILYLSVKKTFSLTGNDSSLVKMRNVAGEIMGAMAAMNYAIENNAPDLVIYYDYAGIEKWCTGEWQAKMDATKNYRDYYNNIAKKLSVRFVKVKAHSGVKYNEEADRLAREALTFPSGDGQPPKGLEQDDKVRSKFSTTLFVKVGSNFYNEKQLVQQFKTEWKKRGRKLSDVKKVEFFVDNINNGYRWKVETSEGIVEHTVEID